MASANDPRSGKAAPPPSGAVTATGKDGPPGARATPTAPPEEHAHGATNLPPSGPDGHPLTHPWRKWALLGAGLVALVGAGNDTFR